MDRVQIEEFDARFLEHTEKSAEEMLHSARRCILHLAGTAFNDWVIDLDQKYGDDSEPSPVAPISDGAKMKLPEMPCVECETAEVLAELMLSEKQTVPKRSIPHKLRNQYFVSESRKRQRKAGKVLPVRARRAVGSIYEKATFCDIEDSKILMKISRPPAPIESLTVRDQLRYYVTSHFHTQQHEVLRRTEREFGFQQEIHLAGIKAEDELFYQKIEQEIDIVEKMKILAERDMERQYRVFHLFSVSKRMLTELKSELELINKQLLTETTLEAEKLLFGQH